MNIHDYLIDQAGLDWSALLAEWRWRLPPEFTVWLFTRAGDLFITLPDGSIHVLDVGAGELRRGADNRDNACTRINRPEVAEDWLMIPVVDQLVASGWILAAGQCYSFKMLPVLGGSYAPEGRAILPICEHFGAWGSLHRQIATLPDGAQVKIEVTE
jgi:hypothetical protein